MVEADRSKNARIFPTSSSEPKCLRSLWLHHLWIICDEEKHKPFYKGIDHCRVVKKRIVVDADITSLSTSTRPIFFDSSGRREQWPQNSPICEVSYLRYFSTHWVLPIAAFTTVSPPRPDQFFSTVHRLLSNHSYHHWVCICNPFYVLWWVNEWDRRI